MRHFLKLALPRGEEPTGRKRGQIDQETDGREAASIKAHEGVKEGKG